MPDTSSTQTRRPRSTTGANTAAIFLVLRRMRAPLIVLILSFWISVFGLTLVPGRTPEGDPWRMDFFDAFYFISFTATTIGFGEIPYPLTTQQRLWVTMCIYMSVIAWAYAFGTVLSLIQDRGFREALSLQRFERRVLHFREPFLLIVGYGQAGSLLAKALDRRERRIVVMDIDPTQIEQLDLASYRADVPALTADARDPNELMRAGLTHPQCEGVIALTDDDEANLAVVMAAHLLRPGLRVVARCGDSAIIDRMRSFGRPMIVDAFNLYGDELMRAVANPQTFRLMRWLSGSLDDTLPEVPRVPREGRWVVCGYGQFGGHLVKDLRRQGLSVTVIDPDPPQPQPGLEPIKGEGTDPDVLAAADLRSAVAFVATTHNDFSNVSLLETARRKNPELFLVGRQNDASTAALFEALNVASVLVPTRLVALEVMARIGTPMLWRFLQGAQNKPDSWAEPLLERLVAACGTRRPQLWQEIIDEVGAPALCAHLEGGTATLGQVLLDPDDRQRPLSIVALLIRRATGETLIAPPDDTPLLTGDRLLLAGRSSERRILSNVLQQPQALELVLHDHRIGQSWLWRTFVDR